MTISKHMRYGPVMLPGKHSILLHNAFFARHTVHIHPTSQENFIVCKFQNENDKKIRGKDNTNTHTHPRCIAQIYNTCTPACPDYE